MGMFSLYGLALFAATAQALAFPGPNPTYGIVLPAGIQSPRPTDPPKLKQRILKRQSSSDDDTFLVAPDNTCGYISGLAGMPPPSPPSVIRRREQALTEVHRGRVQLRGIN